MATFLSGGSQLTGSGSHDSDTTYNAANGAAGGYSVQHCHDQFCSTGDVIQILSGSYTWSGSLSITKAITLLGSTGTSAGNGSSDINTQTGGALGVTLTNAQGNGFMINATSGTVGHIRLQGLYVYSPVANSPGSGGNFWYACNFGRSDFNFSSNTISSPGNQFTVIVSNCVFDSGSYNNYTCQATSNGIIFSQCTFQTGIASNSLCGIQFQCAYGNNGHTFTWNAQSTMGLSQDNVLGPSSEHLNVGDTAAGYMGVAGLNCSYVENCTVKGGSEGSMNGSNFSRVVLRSCTFTDAVPFTHGQDTDPDGNRHYEIYGNTFNMTSGNPANLGNYCGFRGATGLVANNTFNVMQSGRTTISLNCQQLNRVPGFAVIPTAYPAPRQVGSGWSPSSSAPYGNPATTVDGTGWVLEPFYIWNNGGANGQSVDGNNYVNVPGYIGVGSGLTSGSVTPGFTFTATATSGSNTLTAISLASATPSGYTYPWTAGMGIYDPAGRVPLGTTVTAVNGGSSPYTTSSSPTSITMSASATGSGTATLYSGYLTRGHDFIVGTARPGWSQFTFPHPLVAGAPTATPTLVQHVASGMDCNGVLSFIVPLPNAAGAGNLLVLGIQYSNSATGITVTDNKSNTWTLATSTVNAANAQKMAVYYAANVAAGTQVVTATFTGISGFTINVGTQAVLSEFYNVATSSPVDGTPVASSTSLSPGTITTSLANDLIYYWAVDIQSFKDAQATGALGGGFFNGTGITPGSGFTLLSADLQVGSTDSYTVQTTAGAIAPTSTVAPTGKVWASIAVAFKAATAGTAPTAPMRVLSVQHTLLGSLTTSNPTPAIPLQFPSRGNLLIGTWNGFGTITSVTDSGPNTWSTPSSALATNPYIAQVVYAANAVTSSSLHSLKLNLSTNTLQSILILYDVIGAATSPFSNAAITSGTQGSTGNLTTSSITPGNSNGLVVVNSPISFGTVQDLSPSGSNYISDIVCNTQNNDNPGVGTQNSTLDEDNAYGHVYNTSAAPLTFVWKMTSISPAAEGWASVAAAFASGSSGGVTIVNASVLIR